MKRKSLLTLMMSLMVVVASADVAINETNFPDENFRNYLLSQSYGSDGVLTDAESAGITSIDVHRLDIKSLQGIEFFTALTEFFCFDNQLTSLDISKNTALTGLYCTNNQLTALDVSKNTKLTNLRCDRNQLTSLDVSKNTALTGLHCGSNRLTSLDVSKNTVLTTLYCHQNEIKGAAMNALVASLPTVSSGIMYVINNENEQNVMTTTQVAAAKAKGWMPQYYDGSSWQEYAGSEPTDISIAINETNFPDANFRNWLIKQSYGSDGILLEKEIAGVTSINVSDLYIQNLKGIEFFTSLTELNCSCNQLTSLDVSKNMALTLLQCSDNKLTSLDVSECKALTGLRCNDNQLTSLDVSGCKALIELRCNDNQLTSLDVSGCMSLTYIDCPFNQLISLDVSECTTLTWLYCYRNQIKGAKMDALIGDLPTVSSGIMQIIYNENEGNVMTTTQVAAAKAKGWNPRYTINGWEWLTYAGSEPEVLKCATPMIAYFDGKLVLKCATQDVKYVCNLGFETDASVSLPSKVKISIYATRDGYEPSDILTQEINTRLLLGKVGDVNGDGEVGMSDVMFIMQKILNGKFPDE